jgi:hypothetical protein
MTSMTFRVCLKRFLHVGRFQPKTSSKLADGY